MSDEFKFVLGVCFNGPHELVNEDFKNIDCSFDVLEEIVDIDACNEFGQHDIEQEVYLFFANIVNL